MKRRIPGALLLAPAVLATAGAGSAQSADPRIDQIQVIGTHNSYALPADPRAMKLMAPRLAALHAAAIQRLDAQKRAQLAEEHPGGIADPALALDYVQMPIEGQLRMGVRSLELDLNPDPAGGAYADPLPYRELRAAGAKDLAPIYEDILRQPGMKVLHVADVDFRSQCPAFRQCLSLLRQWSDANPGHSPVFILLEPKFGGLDKMLPGAAHVPTFDAAAFDEVDAAIRDVLGAERMFTPDDLRGKYPTLEAAALAKAWPRLSAARGKFLFLYLVPGLNLDAFKPYMAGRPSLEGRAAFVQGLPGMAHTAFVLVDNALVRAAEIPDLARRGYMVRSRADIDTAEARRNDAERRDHTLASGAQVVSTDYLSAPNIYGNGYHAAPFPGGWRINPVTADQPSHRMKR
ncbi:hypothetical protein CLG96_06605 [Sphingomonas oleivorans]|uniref:Calcium-dependent phosphoinositide phospholipase C n=1 Tax=Sphingomonas oleivorans TaxID=1735121 RepID=A0A2T5FZT1_9SPHN|nr:Ca2+-dependent phosphoinositide-specific phospholipase C [Sphingomonas oleivorans]PTQ12214.1 hypothetical protein CLG96_06605 [Sphingomonas oleivorans]